MFCPKPAVVYDVSGWSATLNALRAAAPLSIDAAILLDRVEIERNLRRPVPVASGAERHVGEGMGSSLYRPRSSVGGMVVAPAKSDGGAVLPANNAVKIDADFLATMRTKMRELYDCLRKLRPAQQGRGYFVFKPNAFLNSDRVSITVDADQRSVAIALNRQATCKLYYDPAGQEELAHVASLKESGFEQVDAIIAFLQAELAAVKSGIDPKFLGPDNDFDPISNGGMTNPLFVQRSALIEADEKKLANRATLLALKAAATSTRDHDVSLRALKKVLLELSRGVELSGSAVNGSQREDVRSNSLGLPYAISGSTRPNLVMLPAYIVDNQAARAGFLQYHITIIEDKDGMVGFKIAPQNVMASNGYSFDQYTKINFAFIKAGLPVIIDDSDQFIIDALGENHVTLKHCRIALAEHGKYRVQGWFEDKDKWGGMGLRGESQKFDVILDADHSLVVEILERLAWRISMPLVDADAAIPVFEEFITPPSPRVANAGAGYPRGFMPSQIPGRL